MKTYFNRNEKFTLATLYGMVDYLHTIKEDMKKRGKNTRWLSTAHSFLIKAIEQETKDAASDALLQLYKYSRGLYITCLETSKMKRERELKKENDEYVSIENERFLYLCSFAYETCMHCTNHDHENCLLKGIFLEFDIEPLNYKSDDCPYCHNDIKENAYYNVEEDSNGNLFRVQPGLVLKGFKRVRTSPLPRSDWNLPKISV
jgi:hypothetical protein